jgi:hypothetical protein
MPKKFVEAVVKATGRTQEIPAHWIDHPVLGAPFKASSEAKAAAKSADAPAAQKKES